MEISTFECPIDIHYAENLLYLAYQLNQILLDAPKPNNSTTIEQLELRRIEHGLFTEHKLKYFHSRTLSHYDHLWYFLAR